MPQASEELRDKMGEYFGDPIDDSGPWEFLKNLGWTQTSTGWLRHPEPFREISEKEWDCVDFLCEEWDWAYTPGKDQ